MLQWLWEGFRFSHLFFALLMAAVSGMLAMVAANRLWPRHPRREMVLTLIAGLLAASLSILWLGLSDGRPVRVMVLEREGERRVAVVSLLRGSKGGDTCSVGTFALPGGQRVGRTVLPESSCSMAEGLFEIAWFDGYRARAWFSSPIRNFVAVDLWTGRRRLDVLSSLGQLPGNGEAKIHSPVGILVRVDLQDGSTRTVQVTPLEPPVLRRPLDTSKQPIEIPGLFQAQALEGSCGCAPSCGTLVLHSSVAFGEGEQQLSLVREGVPAWSQSAADLIGGELMGTIELDGQCVLVGQSKDAHLVWLDPATGQVQRQLSL